MSPFLVGFLAFAYFSQAVNTAPADDQKKQDEIDLKNRILHFHQTVPSTAIVQDQSYMIPTYEEQNYIVPSYQDQSYILPSYEEPTGCIAPSYQQAVYAQPTYQRPNYQYQYYSQNCDGYRDVSDICTPYGIIHTGTDISSHLTPAPVVPEVDLGYGIASTLGYSGVVPGVINAYPSYTGNTYQAGPTFLNLPKTPKRNSY